MSSQELFFAPSMNWIGMSILIVFLGVGPAAAQHDPANYTFVVASGFLCDPRESGVCLAMAKSANGDAYQLSGAGTFSTQSKSVTAAGTFNHESANGAVLETGVWLATELVSFNSYGAAPGALPRQGLARGPSRFGPKRFPMLSGSVPTGGLAVFRIRLFPVSGDVGTAVLQLNCALGEVPRERSMEGIRLSLGRNGTEFSEEVSGRVMFLSMRSGASRLAKTPEQKAAPESTQAPNN